MNLFETLGQPIFLLIWIVLAPLTYWIWKLNREATDKAKLRKFLYVDFVFAILQTLAFLVTISVLAVLIDYKAVWLLIPPIIYGLADLAENTVLLKFSAQSEVDLSEKPPIVGFLRVVKVLFFVISILLIAILLVIYI